MQRHPFHEHALYLASEAEHDDEMEEAAQGAWDVWVEIAESEHVCLECEGPSPERAYCPDCAAS